jgi:hypothetical protein
LDAADELLWKYGVERQQLDARSQPQQPARFCPSTGATPFLDAFLSRESMPTPAVDLATELFRATGGIGEQMVRTEEDVEAVTRLRIRLTANLD